MSKGDYTTTFSVVQSPEEVFDAIANVRGWWSGEIEGDTARVGDEFTYRYKKLHRSKQRVTEAVRGERIVWRVLDAYLDHAKDKTAWTGTEIHFEIARKQGRTEVRFTHVGLRPEDDCYEACSSAWGFYINDSLRRLIAGGRGEPDSRQTTATQGEGAHERA